MQSLVLHLGTGSGATLAVALAGNTLYLARELTESPSYSYYTLKQCIHTTHRKGWQAIY